MLDSDTRWVPAASSSAPLQASDLGLTPAPTTGSLLNIDDAYRANGMRRPWATQNLNGEGSSNSENNHDVQGKNRRRIYSKDGTSLYWRPGVPLSYENIYLNPDGGEMTYAEKVLKYDELCRTADIVASEALPIRWRPSDAPRIQQPPEEMPEALDARARQRQEMVRQINERGIRMRRNGPVPAPVPIVRDAPAARLPPPPPRAPRAPPARVNQEEADDMNGDLNEDELEGILEVIGMHGPYWVLLQNSLLMSALMCASLGLGVWIPFMIGKTTLLMNPFNILRMPLDFLSRLTDPILDYAIDRMLPFIGTTLSNVWSIVSSLASPILSPIIGSSLGSAALKPLDVLYEEQIVPIWKAFIETMVAGGGGGIQDMSSGNSPIADVAQNITQGSLTSNGTVVGQIARKWTELAYGSSSGDKIAAVAIGYFILFALAFWYFVTTEHAYGETFAKMTRDVLRQQGLILRVCTTTNDLLSTMYDSSSQQTNALCLFFVLDCIFCGNGNSYLPIVLWDCHWIVDITSIPGSNIRYQDGLLQTLAQLVFPYALARRDSVHVQLFAFCERLSHGSSTRSDVVHPRSQRPRLQPDP